MNTFQIVSRGDFKSKKIEENYKNILIQQGWKLADSPELVISIGGDGTMIQAYRDYYHETSAFVGLHTGTLGFYADWDVEESDQLLDQILHTEPEIDQCPLLQVEFELFDGEQQSFLVLNEAVVKSNSISTIIIEVYIEGEHLESFRGDGLLISTPSGSTAYNHSVGGSIVHPTIETMQVTELASINNIEHRTLDRPFVLNKHHELELYVKNPIEDVSIGLDGNEYAFESLRKITVNVADAKIKFARYKPFPFWQRVKQKFLKPQG
jgi:NAD+ kinase